MAELTVSATAGSTTNPTPSTYDFGAVVQPGSYDLRVYQPSPGSGNYVLENKRTNLKTISYQDALAYSATLVRAAILFQEIPVA